MEPSVGAEGHRVFVAGVREADRQSCEVRVTGLSVGGGRGVQARRPASQALIGIHRVGLEEEGAARAT